jgi:hypothetical protein
MKGKLWGILFLILLLPMPIAMTECNVGCADTAGCGAYIDSDGNNKCDLGEEDGNTIITIDAEPNQVPSTSQVVTLSVPVVEKKSPLFEIELKFMGEVAEEYGVDEEKFLKELSEELGIKVSKNHPFLLLNNKYELSDLKVEEIALELLEKENQKVVKSGKNYGFLPITVITILFYFTTLLTSKKGKLKLINHRKIWNILLLATFLVSAILGILLVIRIEFGIPVNLGFNILAWHVYAGIPMVVISIFHILWHISYLEKLFKFS